MTNKPKVKKAPAKKARVKKVTPQKTVFEKFEDSVIVAPFKVVNKTFLASLGLFALAQKEFDQRFVKYAKDGEKVLDEWEGKVENFRKDVEKKVDDARIRVRDTFKKAA